MIGPIFLQNLSVSVSACGISVGLLFLLNYEQRNIGATLKCILCLAFFFSHMSECLISLCGADLCFLVVVFVPSSYPLWYQSLSFFISCRWID